MYYDWANSPRSAVAVDGSLAFESPVLKAAFEEWSRQSAGAIPSRRSFTARSVRGFVGHLTIFERAGRRRYRVRLMGTRVTAVIGEMQGRMLEEALPRDVARRWNIALEEVLLRLRPARIVHTVAFNNLDFLEAEILLAPLLDESGKPTMVFAAVTFRSGIAARDKFEAIAARPHS